MKKIIDGVAYDTELAQELARGDHGHEWSQASWTLYKMPAGAYFEIVADHDGVMSEFNPLSFRQARIFVEKNANHLFEQYFGVMPEAKPARYSRRTLLTAIEVIQVALAKDADLTRWFLALGADLNSRCDGSGSQNRLNALIGYTDEDASRRTEDGELLIDAIVEKAVTLLPAFRWQGADDPKIEPNFIRALNLDGFSIFDDVLQPSLPEELSLPEAQDELTQLLKKHKFTTLKGHLDQALSAHGRSDWASANAQLRTFFEGLFDEICARLDSTGPALRGAASRDKLLALNFLKLELNEWNADGKNFLNGLFKRLHPEGSHLGLSDQDDSTFRRHMILLAARLFLVRFDKIT